jgi:hypothetical protein
LARAVYFDEDFLGLGLTGDKQDDRQNQAGQQTEIAAA